MRLENTGLRFASNSRAELGAILEALRQNERDDLEIESDSLTSLRAICNLSEKYEDINRRHNWEGIQNEDLLKSILIRLRTRKAQTYFKWVKGHELTTTVTTGQTPSQTKDEPVTHKYQWTTMTGMTTTQLSKMVRDYRH